MKPTSSSVCWRKLLLAGVFLMCFQVVWSQTTITGTITDADSGDPLIGANVLVKGTTTGTITDFDGTYSLSVPAGATTLIFSYTGYSEAEMDIDGQTVMDFAMSSGTELEEIVVTGYGTQKSKEVTGSIAHVDADDFNQGNVNDATQLLQGKVGGLVIARPGSNPNKGFSIRLRGLSTVGASTEPLIVIDGVLGGDLNSVEPQDIESIDVLKDGSAAAIYGTRGASGVILVTTKKGVAGQSRIEYTGQFTLDVIDNVTDVLDPDEYRSFGGGNDLGSSTDWFDEITQTGISHIHNISLSGGAENTTYRLSGNFRDVQGIARTTGFQRLNFRANLSQRALNDRLKVTANLATSSEDANLGFDQAFRYATIYNPTSAVTDGNERWDGYAQQVLFDYYNPVAIIEQNTSLEKTKTITGNIRGDYSLTKDLTVGLFYSQQRSNENESQYYDKNSFWQGENANGQVVRNNLEKEDQLFRIEGNYRTTFGRNTDFTLLGAYEYQDFDEEGFGLSAGNFLTDAFQFNNIAAAQDFATGNAGVGSGRQSSKLIAFFGRATVNIADTYFASASIRREGSSRFGADEKWGVFPAISVGVDLVKAAGISGFDQLKLRAGFGVTGNNGADPYLSLQRFGPTGNFFFNGGFVQSFGPISNANPNLRWETKSDINVGVDFSLLDYRLTGSLEYYNATTKDGIFFFNVPVPPNLFSGTFFNVGEVNNSGLELTLGYNFNLGRATWQSNLTASKWFTPELVSLTDEERGVSIGGFVDGANLGSPGQNGTPLIRLEEGAPIGQLWGLVIDQSNPTKVIKVTEQDENGNDVTRDKTVWNFVDVDGDGTLDDIKDRDVIGNGFPEINLGWNNSFNYGNFDINVFFRAVLGHELINTFRAFYEAPGQISAYNILRTSSNLQGLEDQPQFSSYHVEKGDFVTLENLTLGYTIDSAKLPSGFSKMRFFFTGQNLFTLTGYSGVSPEARLTDDGSSFGSLAPGIDRRNTYFTARGFTFGINLGL